MMSSSVKACAVGFALVGAVQGFAVPSPSTGSTLIKPLHQQPQTSSVLSLSSSSNNSNNEDPEVLLPKSLQSFLASMAMISVLTLAPLNLLGDHNNAAFAYNDYASDTVQSAMQTLKDAGGDADRTFDAYENIAEIIAEGKGIGGSVDYKGVTLDRGYIADEDTSIYNPGLTLLTEGEKGRLVESLMQSRQAGIDKNQWSEKNQDAYAYLKFQLDPLHMTELRGYLKVAPFLVGFLYVGVLAVQQFARDLFPVAYIAAVLVLVAPAAILILTSS
ncbi:expressed unknown protein [Seminavis robusta]|uniref:Uncharacterized protein n=1 Tax=Seminavis robusta TaxID=568900 RepID=A0A9N8DXG5_9STRA|nr:expressed unknown protein [Seminavis robusta]|eukprot:Sro440_g143520.1 n/a (274) ;mRNA; r:42555-43376